MSDPDKDTSSNWTPPTVAELQAMLPQYEVEALWGRGGMGAVYKGRQKSLHRDVAIKVLPENFAAGGSDSDPHQFVERFKLEARSMANLDHPAILSVHDFGQTEQGQLYLVMEFVDGMDIFAYLQHHGGTLPDKHAIAICSHVLDALQYAHDSGVIHRDIKPSNVLINSQGRVKLADFGLAKRIAEEGKEEDSGAPITMPNMAMGTPDYVAPETLDSSQEADGRADLYAVGVMLYELLTGKLPRGQFKSPAEMVPGLDVRFDEVISKALQTDPGDRYASATTFRADLDKILSQPIPQAEDPQSSAIPLAQLAEAAVPAAKLTPGTSKPEPTEPEKSKAPLWIGVGLVGVLAIGGLVAFLMKSDDGGGGASVTPASLPVNSTETQTANAAPSPSFDPEKPDAGPSAKSATRDTIPDETVAVAKPAAPGGKDVSPPSLSGRMPEPHSPPAPAKPYSSVAPASLPVNPAETPATPATPTASPPVDPKPVKPPLVEAPAPSPPDPEATAKEENAKLAAISGLTPRLEGYLTARRAALAELAAKYLKALDGRMNQAADAGDLALTKAYRAEKALVEALQTALAAPGSDPVASSREGATLPELATDAPEGLLDLRGVWEGARQKIRVDLDGKLQQSLKLLESELTKARELEQAERVFAFREEFVPKTVVAAIPESKPGAPTPIDPTPKKATRVRHDPELSRKAAEHAMGMGAGIEVLQAGKKTYLSPGKSLPEGDFQLVRVDYPNERGIPITDADFQILTQAIELEWLDFGVRNEVQVTSLEPLRNTPALQKLEIQSYRAMTRQDCEIVSTLKQLGLLALPNSAVDMPVEDFEFLMNPLKLDSFTFSTLKDVEKFAVLGKQQELKRLSLGNRFGDEQIRGLAGFRKLESLATTGAPITVEGLKALHPDLSKTLINIGLGSPKLDATETMRFICHSYPLLTGIHLRGEIAADAFQEIGTLKELKIGFFSQASFTPLHFAALAECRELVTVTIGCGHMAPADVAALKKLRNFKELKVVDNGIQFDPGVFEALPSLRQLTKLDLPKSQVTPDQLAALKKEMPDCDISLVEAYQ